MAAVEAAIITPIFLLLVIGIIEFGLAFKDQLAITSAVRAGARIASAEPRIATFATDAAAQVAREGAAIDMTDVKALWVYQADASGHPIGAGGTFDSCATNCVQFTWNGSQDVRAERRVVGRDRRRTPARARRTASASTCRSTIPASPRRSSTRSGCSSYTVMRFEPIPTLQTGGCK